MIYSTPAIWQPPTGTSINRANPLTVGLKEAFVLPWCIARVPDPVAGRKPTPSTTFPTLNGSINGPVVNFASSGNCYFAMSGSSWYGATTAPFSIVFSLYVNTVNNYNGVYTTAAGNGIYLVKSGSSTRVFWYSYAGSANVGSPNLAPLTWYNIALTYDGANINLYVNGTLYGPTAISNAGQHNNLVNLGGDTYSQPLAGQMSFLYMYNYALSANNVNSLFGNPWQIFQSPSLYYLDYLYPLPYAFSASGLAISGSYGGAKAGPSPGVAGLAISGAYGGSTAGPSPGVAGMAISGAPGGNPSLTITVSVAGMAISGYPGGATAGPSPGAAGLAISGAPGGTAETVTVLLAGLGISGAPGGATAGPSPGVAGMAISGGLGGTAESVAVSIAALGIGGDPGGFTCFLVGQFGYFQAGDLVPIALPTTVSGNPASPDFAPMAVITRPDTVALPAQTMGMNGGSTDWLINFFLDGTAKLGTYDIEFTFSVLGTQHTTTGSFVVVAGGDIGGDVISLYAFTRPDSQYILAQLTSGMVVCGRNPTL